MIEMAKIGSIIFFYDEDNSQEPAEFDLNDLYAG